MIETKEKTIDNRQVMVTQYPGMISLTNKMKILKLLGPGIGDTLGKVNLDDNVEGKLELLIQTMGSICAHLDPVQFTDFVLELLKGVRLKVNGEFQEVNSAIFDLEFAGNLLLMYKILWFTLEVNYGNFFGKGGLGEILKKKSPVSPAIKK